MKIAIPVLAVAAMLLSLSARAHPDGHDFDTKPLATTCAELELAHRFEVDPAYPEIKALIAKCEAARKPAAAKPASTPTPRPAKPAK